MNRIKAYFIPHCDNEMCDLGVFNYTCPYCKKNIDDYEIWWEHDNLFYGTLHVFNCKKCHELLTVEFDKEVCQFFVFNVRI